MIGCFGVAGASAVIVYSKVSSLLYRHSQCVVCCRTVPEPSVVTPRTSLPRISYAGGDTLSVSVENLGVSTSKLMQVMLASKYLATAVSYTCDTVNPVLTLLLRALSLFALLVLLFAVFVLLFAVFALLFAVFALTCGIFFKQFILFFFSRFHHHCSGYD